MHALAPAKINLCLAVRGRSRSGYHLLDSLVGFLDLADRLHFRSAATANLTVIGPHPTEHPEDNLVLKALRALETCDVAPHHVTLWKNIPSGAGLGGGSADAAAVLRALGSGISKRTLYDLALKLGADVPVCLFGRPARVRGIGEQLTAIADFPVRHLVLMMPEMSLSTAEVFGQKTDMTFSAKAVDPGQPRCWYNDLEAAACALCPAVGEILARLRKLEQVITAGMSGSGSCCFAALPDQKSQKQAMSLLQREFPDTCVLTATLLGMRDV